MQKIIKDLSLVCATLGSNKKISTLLESIQVGSHLPSEIIIVTYNLLTLKEIIEKLKLKGVNVKIIVSLRAAQVFQRNLGIYAASGQYILQCDDDIQMFIDSIGKLYKFVTSKNCIVVSPRVITTDGKSIYLKNKFSEISNKFIFLLFNLRWPNNSMQLSISGRNYAPVTLHHNAKNEWLPSCLIYNKELFKLATTYEDQSGKGYFEDIIFTHSLYKNGIDLIVAHNVFFLHPKIDSIGFNSLFSIFKKQIIVCKIFKLNKYAAYLDMFLYSIFLSVLKVKRCFSI
jgi:glycosyltransferase involved in cell wall biosynthesis